MNTHDIHVEKTHPSGAEEWYCSTCNRRFIVQWSPEYQFIVLEPGDPDAVHNMGRGAMVLITPRNDERPELLQPWLDWLKKIDIEAKLDEESQ
jgi:hypothetical protein